MARNDSPVASCPDCEERRTAEDPNEVVRFYRRHHAVTGHDVVWERPPSLPDLPPNADVEDAVAALGDPDAALGTVAAAASEWGWTVGETLDAVHDRRLTGALWEPRDDHVAVV
ncbi:hypothetical protein [Haloplanus halophilus]|uniref:hypothetical protein n=1 Tax=Haloplanus halophilus TaxID=2949993 RepID=UPI00203C2C04|nr:hypothetical protein [Haloplanus sp. GDY1]